MDIKNDQNTEKSKFKKKSYIKKSDGFNVGLTFVSVVECDFLLSSAPV